MSGSPEDRKPGKTRVRAAIRLIPLIGPLANCRAADHIETFKQVFLTLLFATMPFWLGALVIKGMSEDHSLSISKAFWSTVWDGELFMCATSLLAPLFSIALEDPNGVRKFPGRYTHFVLAVVVILIASVFFALGVAKTRLQQPYTFHISVFTFWIAAIVFYLSTVYHTNRSNAPRAFRDHEEEFTNSYKRHRQ